MPDFRVSRWAYVFCFLASIALIIGIHADSASGQAVYSTQDSNLGGTGGVKINGATTTCAAPHWTGWIRVPNMRSIVYDVDYTVGGAGTAPTGWTATCETSRLSTTVAGTGRRLPTVATTCAAHACTGDMGSMTWARISAVTEYWTFTVDNIPAPYIECLFTCTGAPDADDNLTVYARGITP
jgi:hypothetical protein